MPVELSRSCLFLGHSLLNDASAPLNADITPRRRTATAKAAQLGAVSASSVSASSVGINLADGVWVRLSGDAQRGGA
jgi:hypothetical protein